jgi:hypothetical protein
MRPLALTLALLVLPGIAGAVPKSPGVGKRFLGNFTDRVHPYEVRSALDLHRTMRNKGMAEQTLVNRVKTMAPRLSLWSLHRLLSEMSAEGKVEAVGHYVDQNAPAVTPKQLLSVLSSLQPEHPQPPIHPSQQITHEATTNAKREVLLTKWRLEKMTYQKQVEQADAYVAKAHDAQIMSFVRLRNLAGPLLSTADLAVLAKGAKLSSTRDQLERAIVELTR